MTAAEKVEQAVTGRPNSYVPARALLSLLGRSPSEEVRPPIWNHAMHWPIKNRSPQIIALRLSSFTKK